MRTETTDRITFLAFTLVALLHLDCLSAREAAYRDWLKTAPDGLREWDPRFGQLKNDTVLSRETRQGYLEQACMLYDEALTGLGPPNQVSVWRRTVCLTACVGAAPDRSVAMACHELERMEAAAQAFEKNARRLQKEAFTHQLDAECKATPETCRRALLENLEKGRTNDLDGLVGIRLKNFNSEHFRTWKFFSPSDVDPNRWGDMRDRVAMAVSAELLRRLENVHECMGDAYRNNPLTERETCGPSYEKIDGKYNIQHPGHDFWVQVTPKCTSKLVRSGSFSAACKTCFDLALRMRGSTEHISVRDACRPIE